MASVTLSQSSEYRLVNEHQDWHGWNVHDNAGRLIGRVADFIIDTEESRATALVLDSGAQVPLEAVLVGEGSLMVWGGGTSATVNAPPLPLFEAGTLDVMERAEIPVFRKTPVVIEEIVIRHDVVEREERIQTTLRRRDVQVMAITPAKGDDTRGT
jgi:sporulation protein YlmC with PRC-barrel domain